MSESVGPKRIKTTQTAFDIIGLIKDHNQCTLTDIADEVDISKSTLHTHLQTLCDMGYLIKDNNSYRLGLRFLTLGGHVQHTGNYGGLFRIAKPEIDELADQTEERVQLVVEEQGWGFHLYQSLGNRAVMAASHPGSRVPLYATSVGKAILAHMGEDQATQILEKVTLSSYTSNTITDQDQLLRQFDQIRNRGYAIDEEERVTGIHCIAAPIVSDDNEIIGAISVSIPKKRAQTDFFRDDLPPMVMNAARVIGLNTTYS